MESPPSALRLRLVLGKYPVTEVSPGLTGCKATVKLTGSLAITIDCPIQADIQLGDLLTLYTEVPLAEPSPTSKQ